MANQTFFIEKAHKEALAYADKVIETSREVKNHYIENDVFYQEIKKNSVIKMILSFVVGIVAFISKGEAIELFASCSIAIIREGIFEEYISRLYTTGAIFILAIGVKQLLLLLYAKKINMDIGSLDIINSKIEEEKGFAHEIKNVVQKAIVDHYYIPVRSSNNWNSMIGMYQSKADAAGSRTRKIGTGIIVGTSLLLLAAYIRFFGRFMAMIIAELYGYTGVLIVCISYLLLMKLIYNIQITLASYSIKVSRRLGFILFGWFQIALIFFLIRRGVFATLGQIFRYIYGGDLDLPSGLLYLLFECLRNKVVIALIIISVIGIMNLFRTNLEHEVLARKQGVDLPLEDGGTRHVDAKQKRYPIFFACLFVVVAPFTMSGILSKGMSLRSIFFYLLIVSAWFQISKSFTGDALEIMYGKRLRWVKSAFFCSYMFLTLALVSNYELGSVFLILSQSCPLWLFISRRTQNFIREYSI